LKPDVANRSPPGIGVADAVGSHPGSIFPSLPAATVPLAVGVAVPSLGCLWSDIAGTPDVPGDAVPGATGFDALNADHGALTKVEFAPSYPMVRLFVLDELA
jgi:hypothetical protein